MTQEVTLVLVLAALQVLVLRGSQIVLPQFYFSSGALFLQSSEVMYGAILFRLAIPFSSGLLVPLLISENELQVGAGSGAFAWFLMLWPILWAPDVMLPLERRRWVYVLLLSFWAAFTTLPVSGAALTIWVRGVVTDSDPNWWSSTLAQELVVFVPFTFAVFLVSRLARRRVSFVDSGPEVDLGEEIDWPVEDSETTRPSFGDADWHLWVVAGAILLMPIFLLGI